MLYDSALSKKMITVTVDTYNKISDIPDHPCFRDKNGVQNPKQKVKVSCFMGTASRPLANNAFDWVLPRRM